MSVIASHRSLVPVLSPMRLALLPLALAEPLLRARWADADSDAIAPRLLQENSTTVMTTTTEGNLTVVAAEITQEETLEST